MNTLIIGDTHIPFCHRDYLDFCRQTADQYKCKRIVHIGDLVDHHAISFHDKDPNGRSPSDELKLAKVELAKWVKAFPALFACKGNHDELPGRKGYTHGLPTEYFRPFGDVLGLPKSWQIDFKWDFGTWMVTHGTGSSGHDAAFKQAQSNRMSLAQGHIHTAAGVKFHASPKDIIWGMQVGCGIDRRAYAFNYGRDFKDKPILGCGVVLENGRVPLFKPMSL